MNLQTYLFFDGQCEEAITLYRSIFGAELLFLMRYSEAPDSLRALAADDKIFHATMQFGDTMVNMSDAMGDNQPVFGGFALLIHLEDVVEAERAFAGLAARGVVRVPLEPTLWAERYGIVEDPFGINWKMQVNHREVAPEP
jgi:PhnB protein